MNGDGIDGIEVVVAGVAGELRLEQRAGAERPAPLRVPHPLGRVFLDRLVVGRLRGRPVADAAGEVVLVVLRAEDSVSRVRRLQRELQVDARADVLRVRDRADRIAQRE